MLQENAELFTWLIGYLVKSSWDRPNDVTQNDLWKTGMYIQIDEKREPMEAFVGRKLPNPSR
jgi:hypothetical protein